MAKWQSGRVTDATCCKGGCKVTTSEASVGVIEQVRGEAAESVLGGGESNQHQATSSPPSLGGDSDASIDASEVSTDADEPRGLSGATSDDAGSATADHAALESALESARAQLRASEEALAKARVEREVLEAAFHAGAIDLDAVSALVEKLMKSPREGADSAKGANGAGGANGPGGAPISAIEAVRTLREHKPALFRPTNETSATSADGANARALSPASGAVSSPAAGRWARVTRPRGAMSARSDGDSTARLRDAADVASATGDRGALMQYLRLRRAAG